MPGKIKRGKREHNWQRKLNANMVDKKYNINM
jgi:hypothetical protein